MPSWCLRMVDNSGGSRPLPQRVDAGRDPQRDRERPASGSGEGRRAGTLASRCIRRLRISYHRRGSGGSRCMGADVSSEIRPGRRCPACRDGAGARSRSRHTQHRRCERPRDSDTESVRANRAVAPPTRFRCHFSRARISRTPASSSRSEIDNSNSRRSSASLPSPVASCSRMSAKTATSTAGECRAIRRRCSPLGPRVPESQPRTVLLLAPVHRSSSFAAPPPDPTPRRNAAAMAGVYLSASALLPLARGNFLPLFARTAPLIGNILPRPFR